jgi:hypothetical protein
LAVIFRNGIRKLKTERELHYWKFPNPFVSSAGALATLYLAYLGVIGQMGRAAVMAGCCLHGILTVLLAGMV